MVQNYGIGILDITVEGTTLSKHDTNQKNVMHEKYLL